MIIDWDNIANDAENSPRGVLSEYLPQADELETVIVIVNKKNEEGDDEWAYSTSGSAIKAAGLMAMTLRALERHIDGE